MEQQKARIKGQLDFTHRMMSAAQDRAHAAERLVEAERATVFALIGRFTHARAYRGLDGEAAGLYTRLYLEPQRRKLAAAKVAAAAAHTEHAWWCREHDKAIEWASEFTGWGTK